MNLLVSALVSGLALLCFVSTSQAYKTQKKETQGVQYNLTEETLLCADCFNFVAPSVLDPSAISPIEAGLIVYDTTADSFKGANSSGVWHSLSGEVPAGTIVAFGGTTVPTGWTLCDGSSFTVSSQPGLHAAIGDAFGGDGGTNFNVPDFRGRFLRGVDSAAGNDPDNATRTAMATGGNTGNNVGSVQADEFKSHIHDISVRPDGQYGGATVKGADGSGGPTTAASSALSTPSGGSETRPKNAYVHYIIKL